jgi:hypothetical protein
MSIYEILPVLDLTQSVHAKISIGMHRGVKFKISRMPLIGLETRLGWRTDRKFLRNRNLNEIMVVFCKSVESSSLFGFITNFTYFPNVAIASLTLQLRRMLSLYFRFSIISLRLRFRRNFLSVLHPNLVSTYGKYVKFVMNPKRDDDSTDLQKTTTWDWVFYK